MIDPTIAERLVRLKLLLADGQRRAGDPTALGRHEAVLLLDGACELAIRMCVATVRGGRPRDVPDGVGRLRESLQERWGEEGAQGFDELHRARNLVQHQAVLPDAENLPRWAAETELFVRGLVAAVFEVDLGDIHSAMAVRDERLRGLLIRAEEELAAGNPVSSFDSTWEALDRARSAWATQRRRGRSISPVTSTQSEFGRDIRAAVGRLEAWLDIAAFTAEPSEFAWMTEQRAEKNRGGAPPTVEDARRALVFAIGWVLRFESHTARLPEERWITWRSGQRAPKTGLLGTGPRVLSVDAGDTVRRDHGKVSWRFQLADLPTDDDKYASALSAASWQIRARREDDQYSAAMLLRGCLEVRAPEEAKPTEVHEYVRGLLDGTSEELAARRQRTERLAARVTELEAPYRTAFAAAGATFGEVTVLIGDDELAGQDASGEPSRNPTRVRVELRTLDGISEMDLENAMRIDHGAHVHVHGGVYFSPSYEPQAIVDLVQAGITSARRTVAERVEQQQRRGAALEKTRAELQGLIADGGHEIAGHDPPVEQ